MKPKPAKPVTEQVLLDALKQARSTNHTSRGRTAMELSASTGIPIFAVRAQIRDLLASGKMQRLYEYRPMISGYNRRLPVYIMKG